MEAEKFTNYRNTEDFILDKDFTNWVLNPSKKLDLFWDSFIKEHHEKAALIKDAVIIIKALQPSEEEISQEILEEILLKVKSNDKKVKFNWQVYMKYAAVITLLIAISSLIYFSGSFTNQFPVKVASETFLKGKVILADGSTKEFDSEQTPLKQTVSGNLIVNDDTIKIISNQSNSALNQIIIPYGTHSDIILADGTHIWINSGSQLSYPAKFNSDSREVYLSGEAFFEVKPDPDKPFYVITKDIKIKVLGTTFNVSSYAEDVTVQTVLIEGKVTAGKNKLFASTVELAPSERLTYYKNNTNLVIDKVDVKLYSSWIDGYLFCVNMPISEAYVKLKRYYNQDITVEDGIENITFSGKLDLKDDIKDVLETIAFASSVKVFEKDGLFIIKK